jgi:type I restriction enzyme, S subunit
VSGLPEGWITAPLRDLIALNPKTEAPDESEAGFAPMPKLGTRYMDSVAFESRTWGEIRKGYVHFQDGDVLLAKITPCFENGKAGVVEGMPNGIGAGSSEYFVCRPKLEVLHPRYLLALFKTQRFLREGETLMTGSVGHKRVPKEYLLSTEVPLAPPDEQKRITEKLEALLLRVDACRDRLDRVPAILRRYREAVLSAAVRGRLTQEWRQTRSRGCPVGATKGEPDLAPLKLDSKRTDENLQLWLSDLPSSWRVERASQVVDPGADIVYGIVQPGPKLEKGVPYVRGMDIVDGAILVEQLLRTSPEIAQRYSRASIKGGDVLLGIIRATKVAVVPDTLNGANITQGTARFRPSGRILTHYLATVLEAPETQRWLHGHYRGIDMPGLNLADVRRVPIPLPSLDEQAEIVKRVCALLALAEELENRVASARADVENLTPAIFGKAFRGELVQKPVEALNRSLGVRPPNAVTSRGTRARATAGNT